MKRQTRVDASAVVKGQDGQTGNGENGCKRSVAGVVERVPAVALVGDGNPCFLESLHGSEREALDDDGTSVCGYKPRAVEAVFDGTRFDVVMVSAHQTWWPSSLLDVPPIGKGPRVADDKDKLEREGYSTGSEMPGEFMTREEALECVLNHNRAEEKKWVNMRGRQAKVDQLWDSTPPEFPRSLYNWTVLVEVGQRIDNMETAAVVEIRGTIGTLRQELVYPIRIAKLTPEEIERYKIEAASEEPVAEAAAAL